MHLNKNHTFSRRALAMICEHKNQRELLEAVRQAVRQELQGSQIKITEAAPKAESIQDDVLGFLAALQEEGDDTA